MLADTDKGYTMETTIQQILDIQTRQLLSWEQRLNKKYYKALLSKAEEENAKLTLNSNPLSIWRGNAMTVYIQNLDL